MRARIFCLRHKLRKPSNPPARRLPRTFEFEDDNGDDDVQTTQRCTERDIRRRHRQNIVRKTTDYGCKSARVFGDNVVAVL